VKNFVVLNSSALRAFQVHACMVVSAKLKVDEIHKVAAFLNPATKHLPFFSEAEKRGIQNIVRARMQKLKLDAVTSVTAESPHPIPAPSTSFGGIDSFFVFAESPAVGSVEDEIDTYLQLSPPSSAKPLLQVWDDYKEVLPNLKRLADYVLGVQATSTSSERLFSDAGNIFDDKRTNLGSEKLDDLLFLKWNLTL
jgi:hypothetical protein